jgi:AraC-like DNA-binding protein
VTDTACAAGRSRRHFRQEFRWAFGELPHRYPLSRRLERAASLLRLTGWSVADICRAVGLSSVGSFTILARGLAPPAHGSAVLPRRTPGSLALAPSSELRSQFLRMFAMTPTWYRRAFPPAASHARVPLGSVKTYARPQMRTFFEGTPTGVLGR